MGMYDYLELLGEAQVVGDAADEYSTNEVDLGFAAPVPGINRGNKFGLHAVVTAAFTGLDSGVYIWIVHGAATSPTTKHTCAYFSAAELTLGKKIFIPCAQGTDILRYARGLFDIVSETATAGALTWYFGPSE